MKHSPGWFSGQSSGQKARLTETEHGPSPKTFQDTIDHDEARKELNRLSRANTPTDTIFAVKSLGKTIFFKATSAGTKGSCSCKITNLYTNLCSATQGFSVLVH